MFISKYFKLVIASRIQIDTSLMFSHKNVQKDIFNIIFVSSRFDEFEYRVSSERCLLVLNGIITFLFNKT